MKKINTRKVPIYRDSGFFLENPEQTKKAFEAELDHTRDPEQYIYSRYRNPTVVATEEHLMKLEDAGWALLTQSGMAAIDTAISIFQESKKESHWLFFSDIYGGTNSYIDKILIERRGLMIHRFLPDNDRYDLIKLDQLLSELKPEVLYFEVISNPMLIVAAAKEIIELAKKYGSRVIIDNTFTTPELCKPLQLGADLVIHSATKYFSGHGNITAGVLCGNDELLLKEAIEYRKLVGHMLSPDDAARLDDQLKTFKIRFKKQVQNASHLANVLNKHSKIKRVIYPGLDTHMTHDIAHKQFGENGFGAMITFEINGRDDTEKRNKLQTFITRISEHFLLIPSLGDVETILLPVEAVWGEKYPLPGMLRLSVGIEDVHFIEKVILKALEF